MVGLGGDVPLVEIDICLLADQIAVSATYTLDLREGIHDLLLAIDLNAKDQYSSSWGSSFVIRSRDVRWC